jgi:glutamate N-acetyltransferase/amino-acid N-acetyltransferase
MLCFLTTDVGLPADALQKSLENAVGQSFNRITVDGDMSTNDTVLVLANGGAGVRIARGKELRMFQEALDHVTLELGRMIVRDGEGVTRFVTVQVSGAKTPGDAEAAARAVANSALVKTSWYGGDPNWGRILAAIGYSAATVKEERVDVGYSRPNSSRIVYSLRKGRPRPASFESLCKIAARPEFDLHINLNMGKGRAVLYASDLTEEYVDFNKGDVTDPSSLGG